LEHLQEGEHHVVEVEVAVKWVFITLAAKLSWAAGSDTSTEKTSRVLNTSLDIKASVFNNAGKQLSTSNSED
jgi:hypothetical protein